MSDIFKTVIVIAGAYLIGNVNFALIISKLLKSDVRTKGSGNPGTLNMTRSFGVKIGVLTLVLDALKGALPTLAGMLFMQARLGAHLAAFFVVVGHVFPVFLKFKGGKGIASSIGVCLVLQPLCAAALLLTAVLFIYLTSMGSIASFLVISFPLALEGFAAASDLAYNALFSALLIFGLFALTVIAHRKNILKLFCGTESKTVIKKRKA
ncbi:MAG: glycerol-3-phosphate 1-O-acyltransferase PlsY [Clostridiales bacterium]|jgi:glycerol-3-phosphate acyltransferase PlsY|nr:glycerol-3-phosphate 1-O-acyltransferase PlsY [Clostridiales bacterium]